MHDGRHIGPGLHHRADDGVHAPGAQHRHRAATLLSAQGGHGSQQVDGAHGHGNARQQAVRHRLRGPQRADHLAAGHQRPEGLRRQVGDARGGKGQGRPGTGGHRDEARRAGIAGVGGDLAREQEAQVVLGEHQAPHAAAAHRVGAEQFRRDHGGLARPGPATDVGPQLRAAVARQSRRPRIGALVGRGHGPPAHELVARVERIEPSAVPRAADGTHLTHAWAELVRHVAQHLRQGRADGGRAQLAAAAGQPVVLEGHARERERAPADGLQGQGLQAAGAEVDSDEYLGLHVITASAHPADSSSSVSPNYLAGSA
ncbi:hypothetical protein FQZ97_831770 [compost metagenome]